MAKKKLDLSGMYTDTIQTQDKNNITTMQIQDNSKISHEKYAAYRKSEESIDKSMVAEPKKINMAFTDSVYSIIRDESEKMGVTAAYYVNSMIRNANPDYIRTWYEKLPIKPSKNFVPRRKGQASKRIYVKFDTDVYDKISAGSDQYNQTLTQYVNMILESATRQI